MKVAVVGSGCAGLAATWMLNERSEHEVDLFEADDRPGGHANTVTFERPGKPGKVDVDTGFIVLNPITYPNFLRFLTSKGIATMQTEMTFCVSRDRGRFEWAGDNLLTLFCQPFRLLDPRMWELIYDVLRFNACAHRLLYKGQFLQNISIGKYLHENGYSSSFRDNYLIPMTAAIWSTSPDKCSLDFPVQTLLEFMHNHHLLQIIGKPKWLTIKGGSKVYVNKILEKLDRNHLHLSTRVSSVKSSSNGVVLKTENGTTKIYDHVIFACHSDQALQILRSGNITQDEDRILSQFSWSKNEAILHFDAELMPKSRLAWSSWNYLSFSERDVSGKYKANVDKVALTYWMNELQHIPEQTHGPVLVTLNPPFSPNPKTILGKWIYEHPTLNTSALKAQSEISQIQNIPGRNISFAGAYLRYGFHEDGFTSGMRAAERLGASPPNSKILEKKLNPSFTPLATIFDIIEYSGIRIVAGFIFSSILFILRLPFRLVMDLSFLEDE